MTSQMSATAVAPWPGLPLHVLLTPMSANFSRLEKSCVVEIGEITFEGFHRIMKFKIIFLHHKFFISISSIVDLSGQRRVVHESLNFIFDVPIDFMQFLKKKSQKIGKSSIFSRFSKSGGSTLFWRIKHNHAKRRVIK